MSSTWFSACLYNRVLISQSNLNKLIEFIKFFKKYLCSAKILNHIILFSNNNGSYYRMDEQYSFPSFFL